MCVTEETEVSVVIEMEDGASLLIRISKIGKRADEESAVIGTPTDTETPGTGMEE